MEGTPVPKPYHGAELPIALALALGGIDVAGIDAALAEHRNQVIEQQAEMISSLPRDYELDPGRGDAVARMLATRTPQES